MTDQGQGVESVVVTLTLQQAKEVLRVLRWHAEGRPKSHPLWGAVKQLDALTSADEVGSKP